MRPRVVLLLSALVAAVVASCVAGLVSLAFLGLGDSGGVAGEVDADAPHGTLGEERRIGLHAGRPSRDVWFRMPADAVALRVRAVASGGPVLLRAAVGDAGGESWDEEQHDAALEQTLDLASHVHAPLAGERVLVRVAAADALRDAADPLEVTLRADAVVASVAASVDAGASWDGATAASGGHRQTYEVRVPAGAAALRIDLADAAADLDLRVDDAPPAECAGDESPPGSPASAEWVVLDAKSAPPLPAGGSVWVTVLDPSLAPHPTPFRLVTTLGRDPPAELGGAIELPVPPDPRERAVLCTVELVMASGGGSGTLVSQDGRILTAYHVAEPAARASAAGGASPVRIVVAVTLDPREVARDLYEADYVDGDRDLDLALLRIVRTARGTPLPPGHRFPHVQPARRTRPFLGDLVWTIGYPQIGGSGTRVPVTLSRGVVCGWDRAARCVEIKTDAVVASGSSGGAAFDDRWELLGVPVSVSDADCGERALGSLVPVEAVPESWWGR